MHASWKIDDAGYEDAVKPNSVWRLVSLAKDGLGASTALNGWLLALGSVQIKHRERREQMERGGLAWLDCRLVVLESGRFGRPQHAKVS